MENKQAARDKAFGRFFKKRGTRRVLKEAERAPSMRDRLVRWKIVYYGLPIEVTL
jgi:hypothetical protein